MNERLMNLDDLDKYGQNLITYSDYVNDSMNKIAAGFNNLYSAKIIQGRRSKVFIDVYNEMDESRKNVVDKLYEVKEFVDTVRTAMQNLDADQAKKLQTSLDEMGIKNGKNGNSGGSSSGGNSEGQGGSAPSRTTSEADEQRIREELSKTSSENNTGQGNDETQSSDQDDNKATTLEETETSTTKKYSTRDNISPYDNLNEDYIPPEKMDAEYEKYANTRLTGSRTMSKEEFTIKHSNLSPEEKNYRMQNLIDKDMRNRGTANVSYNTSYGQSSNYHMEQTAENYINNMYKDRNYDPDGPLFGRQFSKGYDIHSIKDLYKNSDGHGGMYTPWTENNVGLTVKETLKVDGKEYTLTVDTDKLPTNREWNQAKEDFIRQVAKPDSIIESSKTTYSFFNLDLEKAKQAYEKTL